MKWSISQYGGNHRIWLYEAVVLWYNHAKIAEVGAMKRLGLTNNQLKIIAMLAMIMDHVWR